MISLQFLITALIVTLIPGTGVVYTMSTVYISPLKKWIRLDARGNKAGVNAQFSLEKEFLAFPARSDFGEKDYRDNHSNLDSCKKIRRIGGLKMQIVKCSTKDITLLAGMNKCLIEDEQSSNTMNLKELEKRMSVFLSGEYDAYFFADDTLEASDKIVGYALVRNTASPLYLRQFYIKKEYRRKHLGSEAFKLLLDYLKADTIDIDVLPWNKSGMAFWKSMGFAEICVSMRYGEKTKMKKLGCRGSA